MPISRDARMDRRRRFLREAIEEDASGTATVKRNSRKVQSENELDVPGTKRKAGYSQDVRRACGQRLVQLIPVRRRSFAAVIFVSLLVPGILLTAHYLVHVTGQLQWWRHPLAIALDIGHPRSIAAWLSSQLWLLCLAATVLTFQLRRHKLDDYNGEYRLWFWLVLTCLIASVDATTSITELFAQALDRWSQVHLGWSGSALVDSTLTVLIGMLGLRMCSELKAVPLSLVFWLTGLVLWAGSAALGRPELKIDLSAPVRYWLVSTLWMGGLAVIWLAALTYLRTVYLEAQRRFLLRGRLASIDIPLRQRIRESMPSMPSMPNMPRMPKFRRDKSAPAAPPLTTVQRKQEDAVDGTVAGPATRRGLGNFLSRSGRPSAMPSAEQLPEKAQDTKPAVRTHAPTAKPKEVSADEPRASGTGLGSWLRRPKNQDHALEYEKVKVVAAQTTRLERAAQKAELKDSDTAERPRRSWLPKISRPKLGLPKLPRPKIPSIPKPKVGGLLSRVKLPKFKLPSLRLAPPGEVGAAGSAPAAHEMRAVNAQRALPNTHQNTQIDFDEEDDDDNGDGRQISKAERKRMRRLQQTRKSA